MMRPDGVESFRRSLENISQEEEPDWVRAGFTLHRANPEEFLCGECSAIVVFWWLHRDWHESLRAEVAT